MPETQVNNFNNYGYLDVRIDSKWAELSHYISADQYNKLKYDIIRAANARGIDLTRTLYTGPGEGTVDLDTICPDVSPGQIVSTQDLVKLRALTKNLVLYTTGVEDDPDHPGEKRLKTVNNKPDSTFNFLPENNISKPLAALYNEVRQVVVDMKNGAPCVECSTSCKQGCGQTCYSSCFIQCGADNCKSACGGTSSCANACVTSCHNETCASECEATCGNGACKSRCSAACGRNACGVNACTITCGQTCAGTCVSDCYASCGGSACTTSCRGSTTGVTSCATTANNCGNNCYSTNCGGSCSTKCGTLATTNNPGATTGSTTTGTCNACTGPNGGETKNGNPLGSNSGSYQGSNTCNPQYYCGMSCTYDCANTTNDHASFCNNACGYQCSFTCKDGGCGGCTGTCSGCETTCYGGCKGTCSGSCDTGCYNNTCKGGCKSSGCSGGCSSSCGNSCYSNTCTGQCKDTACKGKCQNNSCSSECTTGQACTGGCNTGCQSAACGTSCSSNCSGNACTSSCRASCKTACVNTCSTSACKTACSGNCGVDSACSAVSCGSNCTESTCANTCTTECVDVSCKFGCGNACTGTCENTCYSECSSGGCTNKCQASCLGSCKNDGCAYTCSVGCTDTCYNACGTSCVNNCNDTCVNACKFGCENGCKGMTTKTTVFKEKVFDPNAKEEPPHSLGERAIRAGVNSGNTDYGPAMVGKDGYDTEFPDTPYDNDFATTPNALNDAEFVSNNVGRKYNGEFDENDNVVKIPKAFEYGKESLIGTGDYVLVAEDATYDANIDYFTRSGAGVAGDPYVYTEVENMQSLKIIAGFAADAEKTDEEIFNAIVRKAAGSSVRNNVLYIMKREFVERKLVSDAISKTVKTPTSTSRVRSPDTFHASSGDSVVSPDGKQLIQVGSSETFSEANRYYIKDLTTGKFTAATVTLVSASNPTWNDFVTYRNAGRLYKVGSNVTNTSNDTVNTTYDS